MLIIPILIPLGASSHPYFVVMTQVIIRTLSYGFNWDLYTSSVNIPPLTTAFILPTECSTRWIQRQASENRIYSGAMPPWYGSSAVISDYYQGCNPYAMSSAIYSPGMCPSGQTIVQIYQDNSSVWGGHCCNRYVPFLLTLRSHLYEGALN